MANKPVVHTLGDVYLFIHQRAQYVRKQKAASDSQAAKHIESEADNTPEVNSKRNRSIPQ